jgi:hypothetical protein
MPCLHKHLLSNILRLFGIAYKAPTHAENALLLLLYQQPELLWFSIINLLHAALPITF